MSAIDPLRRLAVTSRCTQDWDSMIGNDRVRFCEHCSLHVHNISRMKPAQALLLANRSRGRLCVRYDSTARNEIVTRTPEPRGLHRIGRRVSRIASGAFSAALSVSAVFAEPVSTVRADDAVVREQLDRTNIAPNGGSINGMVMDPNQALVAGATVVVKNLQTQLETSGTTNDSGEFRFDGLASGYYSLRITAPGFAAHERSAVHVDDSQAVDMKVTLTLDGQTLVMGAVAIASPSHPFVKAAYEDDLAALQALIADTDVNLRDPDSGTTALDHAVRNGNRDMVQLLIGSGAKVKDSKDDGSALMQFNEDSTPDLLWDLVNAGANINYKTDYGATPLMSVAGQNNSEILEEMLTAGADVNAADDDGMTALILAASEGRVLNVRLLVLGGASIEARDSDGKTALMHAIENEHKAVIRFLRSKGAVVPLQDNKDKEGEEN
ncbi:MAG TPA: ankyrin repeat domain-containing protein [Pyrinomonadaceae bacterium]|nr:ankyrin repeat domain-containing protein [Pyrinomonadaceae bacterium]